MKRSSYHKNMIKPLQKRCGLIKMRRSPNGRKGQSIVEFALTAPIFLIIVLFLIDISMFYFY
ncbi:MAG: TadE family protein, partial [Verrucomicrobiota bacterium]